MKKDLAREILWTDGVVAAWYLRDDQVPVYNFLHETTDPFLEAGRRYGKTTTILSYVLELLRENPGWICRWVFPEKKTAKTVIAEEMEKIQEDCPDHLKFKFLTSGTVWQGPVQKKRQSKIFLYGVDKDKGKSLRGEASHIVVCDEFGFWSDPTVLTRVLQPTLLTTRGKRIICSTPSEDPAHRYYLEYQKAKRQKRLRKRTIYDNGSLTADDIAKACEDAGGEESVTWKREYLCEHVTDPGKLIVPEFDEKLHMVPDDYPRPEFFTPYVSIDSGFDDNTAALFGYYDFLKQEIVFEAEHVVSGTTTKSIIDNSKLIELKLWSGRDDVDFDELLKSIDNEDGQKKIHELFYEIRHTRLAKRRGYDANKQQIFDIFSDHKYAVSVPPKGDKHASIHEFRVEMKKQKVKIKESCVNLLSQLKVGMWKDERHTDFERKEGYGHLDCIAAAIYFGRIVDRKLNPWPAHPGASHHTHHIPESRPPQGQTEQALSALLSGRARGKR